MAALAHAGLAYEKTQSFEVMEYLESLGLGRIIIHFIQVSMHLLPILRKKAQAMQWLSIF